jgi:S-(hydroxymethyl)glutathione dehydrogenase/alcohol dehydrogenase
MKTLAAVAFRPHEPMVVREVDLAPPRRGEVLVQIKATGLCHSDLHGLDGEMTTGIGFPGIPGHEGAGVVAEVGAGVVGLKPGDHVVPFPAECRQCSLCLSGKTGLCEEAFVDFAQTSRFSVDGVRAFPFQGLGVFSQYTVVREICLAKVRSDAPFDLLSYLGCGVATGFGAAVFTAKVTPGASVIVFGIGGVGLNIVQGARLCGAAQIVAVDTNPAKEAIARKLGATDWVNPRESSDDVVGRLNELTLGGADFTFEAAGNIKLMGQALKSARIGWGVCTIVGMAPDGETLPVAPLDLVLGRKLQGSAMGGVKGRTQIPQLADWMMQGRIDVASLITAHLPLERINEGFDMMRRGNGVRTVVTFP